MRASTLRTRRRPSEPEIPPEARLELAEGLLPCADAASSCDLALRWLARHAGIAHAFCAVSEPDASRLQGVAGLGVPQRAVEKYRVYFDDPGHLLILALKSKDPAFIAYAPRQPPVPLGGTSLLVLPLAPAAEGARGLLLVRSSKQSRPSPTLTWAAEVLGRKLTSLAPAPFSEAVSSARAERRAVERQGLDAVDELGGLQARFLANMSHELRLPLNAILGYTSMLLQGVSGELNAGQRRHLGRVDSNAQHLLRLINDLLDINRLDAGRMPLNPEPFPLGELVREVLEGLEPLIQKSGLAVSSRISLELGTLHTDRQRLKQILVNLVGNALKFTHEGRVDVDAAPVDGGQRVRITVADTGVGIAPDQQRRIFEDFQQVDDSTTRQYGGAGLGLSISRRLAELLGGNLKVESDLGKGSVFSIELPINLEPRR